MPLAKLAPTSLVFGVWDSRDTQVKLPRLVGSTIRAYDVELITRNAQFFAQLEKSEADAFGAPEGFLSKEGLVNATAGHKFGGRISGGVISRQGIRRDAVLNLVALRGLSGSDVEQTRKLQRYILGLSLTALLAPLDGFLREGCLLVRTLKAPDIKVVERTGERGDLNIAEADALEFGRSAAIDFGVGDPWTAKFEFESVKKAVAKSAEDKKQARQKKDKK